MNSNSLKSDLNLHGRFVYAVSVEFDKRSLAEYSEASGIECRSLSPEVFMSDSFQIDSSCLAYLVPLQNSALIRTAVNRSGKYGRIPVLGAIQEESTARLEFSVADLQLVQGVISTSLDPILFRMTVWNTAIQHDHLLRIYRALEDRKVIERAKGILIDRMGIQESEAYSRLRKQAMNKRVPLRCVADSILAAQEVME